MNTLTEMAKFGQYGHIILGYCWTTKKKNEQHTDFVMQYEIEMELIEVAISWINAK